MMRIPRWRYRMLLRNKDGTQVEAVCPDVHKLIELQRQFERCGGGELLELRREDHPIVRVT